MSAFKSTVESTQFGTIWSTKRSANVCAFDPTIGKAHFTPQCAAQQSTKHTADFTSFRATKYGTDSSAKQSTKFCANSAAERSTF